MKTIGEWSEEIRAFWFGANNCEWIAWKGSHQIFVFPCDEYPNPPSKIIQHNKRIESIEDFTEAMQNGKTYIVEYKTGSIEEGE
ncbi:hypothetical protein [Fictibacillus gelatini]|uniref:hypothetical protein n=1 Tax=Fictibacillus gelatini TaxID=225985 RepID=UPI00041D2748|nr:hypothetical protein [Fictibacillus gelatini]